MAVAYYADLGRLDYSAAFSIRKEVAEMLDSGRLGKDVVLFAQHNPAILFSGAPLFSEAFANKIKESGKTHDDHLKEMGIQMHEIPGSKSSFVGPGQFSAYPISNYTRLVNRNNLSGYNFLVDKLMLDVMKKIGLEPKFNEKDVHLNESIVASKNFQMSHRIASGGIHLHISREGLKHFPLLDHGPVTSLEDALGFEPNIDDMKEIFLNSMKKNFGYSRMEQITVLYDGSKLIIRK
jgi:lipoate-protein ligase B